MQPRVAVNLAAYEGEAFIEEQIVSILWQQGVSIHIYIRDDGSSDRTCQIIEDMSEQYPDSITRIVDDRGPQGSAARNFFRLIEANSPDTFDYIAFADQDDIWMPTKLIRAIDKMRQTASIGYSSNLLAYDSTASRAWVLVKDAHPKKLDYLFQGASAGCTYVLSAEAFTIVQAILHSAGVCWPINISHDWVIYAICRSRGLKWIFDEEAGLIYRQHGGNLYGARPGWRDLIAKAEIARSRWYGDHVRWLKHVIVGNEMERAVFKHLESRSVKARFWLIRHAGDFRRRPRDVFLLRIAIGLGLLTPRPKKPRP
jgi:rhamnosyltransferase